MAQRSSMLPGLGFFRPEEWPQLLRRFSGDHPVRRVNQGLLIFAVVLALYLLFDLAMFPGRNRRLEQTPVVSPADLPEITSGMPQTAPLEDYLAVVQRRDVFRSPDSPVALAGTTGAAPAPVSPLQGLRLVGIAWGDDPEVMIDDAEAGKTFFLKPGQGIRSFTVGRITREAAILKADDGKELELK